MQYPGMLPGGLSGDSYADRHLRPFDAEHYSAAGLLMYRRVGGESIELLLPRERPWNSLVQAYDPVALSVFGGKRVPRQERSVETTAVRCFLEGVGQVDGAPDTDNLYGMLHRGCFAIWYAVGKFALFVVEALEESVAGLPDRFMDVRRRQGPPEEFRLLPSGIKKYVKQIETLEWIPGSKLVPAPQAEVTDLLSNILQIGGFKEFLEGTLDPATAWPETGQAPVSQWPEMGKGSGGKPKGKGKGSGGKGKMKDKGWKGGGGYGKGSPFAGKDTKGSMGVYAGSKGISTYPGKGMPVGPIVYPQFDQNTTEMQRQMYGEQLYLLVQPMAPHPNLAQKITGMLLELPQNELLMNLTNQDELQKRVQEALEVLKADGIVA